MEHCSPADQTSAQLLSEVDLGGNAINRIWPNSLPVTCLIALRGGKAGLQSLNASNSLWASLLGGG